MKIVVAATDDQWKELTENRTKIDWHRVNDLNEFSQHNDAGAYFNMLNNIISPQFTTLNKPIFINSVTQTLAELNAPADVYRINGWATFLNRDVWEVVGNIDEKIKTIFENMNIKMNAVSDEPGLVAIRVIAMIINEAYFTVSEKVSSKNEIDTAMKLGTNYPYGPFEWAKLIGKNNILELLYKLSLKESRYQPASLLINEVKGTH